MRLVYDRRASTGVMTNDQAGAVLFDQQLPLVGVRPCLQGSLLNQLIDYRLEQVLAHRLQVITDRLIAAVALQQWLKQGLQGFGDGLLVELAQLIARLALPLRQAGELFVQHFLKLGNIAVESLALLLRQLGKVGLIQRLALFHRRKGNILRVTVQRDAFFQRAAFYRINRPVVALVEGPINGAFLLLIGRVLKHRGEGCQQIVDKTVDHLDQLAGRTGCQADHPGFARLIEVVDVDKVLRGDLALGLRAQIALHIGKTAGSRVTHDKHVVARPVHGHTELQGLDCPLLAENATERFQIVGGREAEAVQIDGGGKLVRGKS